MNEKTLKLCRYLAAVAMAMGGLGNLIGANIGFDSLSSFAPLIFAIFQLLVAGALIASNTTILAVGCGMNALYLLLTVIVYIQWELGASHVLAELVRAASMVLLAVSLLQKKDGAQLYIIAFAVGAVSVCLGYLFNGGYTFLEKMENIVFGVSNLILGSYLPVFVGVLTIGGDAPMAATSPAVAATSPAVAAARPAVVSAVQTVNVDSFGKISKLKELLDIGAISREEFDEKKKEILDL